MYFNKKPIPILNIFQAMKILSKKKLMKKAGCFGKFFFFNKKLVSVHVSF